MTPDARMPNRRPPEPARRRETVEAARRVSRRPRRRPSSDAFLAIVGLAIVAVFSTTVFSAAPEANAAKPPAPAFDVGFLGLHGGVYEILQSHAGPLGLRLRYFDDGEVASRKADFAQVGVLYVQHTRAEDRDAYGELFRRAKQKNPSLRIITFMPNSAELFRGLGLDAVLTDDREAAKYYGSSNDNLRRLLVYTAVKHLARPGKIEPPEQVEHRGLFHPDHAALFPTVEAFLQWRTARGPIAEDQPRVLIAVHSAHLFFQQPKVVEALVRESERQGAVAAAIIDGRSETYVKQVKAFRPHVVLHTCHSSDTLPFRLEWDVPHLHSMFFRKQSIAEWQESAVGLSASETAFHVIGQELIGAIEPQAGAGTAFGQGSSEALLPIPDRVEHLVRRATAHARLAIKPAAQKKVAVIYYDREMGKGELMRGSATGMHLNAPRSLLAVLSKMKQRGYRVEPLPQHEDELLQGMIERGRQVGVWAPADLDRLVRHGSPILIPVAEYEAWYRAKVPESRRKQLEARWGPPPGRFMVWEDKGRKYLVVPRIDLGNVILLPQPLRGEVHGKDGLSSQAHDRTTAPPHNYLATYFWLENAFKADALVHFGTHGSEFFLPGKPNALAARDWPDIIMGGMPNFNPWIIENMVESSPARRRTYAVLVSHLSPPIVRAGLSDESANLREMIDKWELLEPGALKEKFAEDIAGRIKKSRLDIDLHLPANELATPAAIEKASKYLHDIQEETLPVSLHVLGEPPRRDLLPAYMVNILRDPFLRALEKLLPPPPKTNGRPADASRDQARARAEQILELVLLRNIAPKDAVGIAAGKPVDPLPEEIAQGLQLAVRLNADFARTTDEIDHLLKGLDGKFVPPGPGNNPIRNPSAVPTGRNMYLLNPEEVPTRPSWELGRKLADELIARHRAAHGEFPAKIGFDLRSSATFRDYGVMESQILALMGVEPVWDARNLVNDVKLIPRDRLGRPRVDVFIAAGSWYESNLPSRLNLWDKAVRLAAGADEPDNPIRRNTQQLKATLASKGLPAPRADLLATGRIFGIAPGREAGGLYYALERSGDWDQRADIAAQYIALHKNVYTEGAWGEAAAELYDAAIQGTHTVVRSWSDHMTGPLASKYMWLHGGHLCLAVETLTGKRPEYVLSDVRDPDKAGLLRAEDALRREYRVRLLNRKWLEGMMKEGYAGADQMRVMVANSFGWEVTRPGSVGNDTWQEMKNVLVDDSLRLSLRSWYERTNPYAFQDTTAVMLEAIRKGYWSAAPETQRQLAIEYARSVVRHGPSGHVCSGGNVALDGVVRRELSTNAQPGDADLLKQYVARIEAERTAPGPKTSDSAAQAPAPATGTVPAPAALPANAAAPKIATPKAQPANAEPAAAPVSASDAAPPDATAARKASQTAPQEPNRNAAEAASSNVVQGRRLEPAAAAADDAPAASGITSYVGLIAAGVMFLLILIGFITRRGAP